MDRSEDFIVRTMSASEVAMSVEWAAAEGWNPGWHDAHCFREADPAGFFVGLWRGEPVACLAAVAYDEHFGFIGLYIVKPEFRGKGLGMRIWQHGMRYLGERNIGLDGVVAQQANYGKSGFRLAYRNIRYEGRVSGIGCAHVAEAADVPFEQLLAYDRQCFPVARERFVSVWIAQPDAVALATIDAGRVAGYGVVRRCRAGCKIGPLFADDADVATGLFRALASRMPGEAIVLDVPETNLAAVALAERHGMSSVFETARMYTKEAPAIAIDRVFGVTSFELG
ncbi:GCN5 family acetyltransferase [Burkholderia diffusa]|uniref:GCN5 family acetyltransferase n=1 Tax=Burkholderia diffusa TaxID=488732 RepID=A0AAW3PL98_9BURK|nr:GNAT family N-acetyltransferase [Burkholderia diffusa]KVH48582.1 GCN5 family acetyltransferase [Burkholderia diffusa]KVM99226.1 GCN5 family acetyltransferase [Burkholderia diffusa]KWF27311.1 GCN5 family acetyltransferase [Burkholderia diffusa]KWF43723.1 GCN5 family acetyltransferase [Burkholderia diffusa]KWF54583.1 GCN5 family acetyltransferase [Burkholderia diffusa]